MGHRIISRTAFGQCSLYTHRFLFLRCAASECKAGVTESEDVFENYFEEASASNAPVVVTHTTSASLASKGQVDAVTRSIRRFSKADPFEAVDAKLLTSSSASSSSLASASALIGRDCPLENTMAPTATLDRLKDNVMTSSGDLKSPISLIASTDGDASHLSTAQRRTVVARKQATTIANRREWLELHPDRLSVQQDLVNSKSAARVLAVCTPEEVAVMDTVNLATALQRIAKLVGPSRSVVVTNERFAVLLEAIWTKISDFSAHSLTSVLWAVVRLELSPTWLDDLLTHCSKRLDEFTVKDLSIALACLAKAPNLHASTSALNLKDELIAATHVRIAEFTSPMDVVCLAAALSRLGFRDEPTFTRIAERSLSILDCFNMSDISSLVWAFANVNLLHGALFRQIRGVLQQQMDNCTPKELVQISWAFSKVKQADAQLMIDFVAPVVRAKMLEFDAPRDLCTLVWTFSNARIIDTELFNDLAHTLSAKVKLMNAHDVASVVVAFSSIEYAHQKLFRALQKHTKRIVHTFSPLQLARTIYGFGVSGIDDESLFRLLSERAIKQRHLLHAKNIVEIIIGLSEAEYTPVKVLQALLGDVSHLTRWIDAQDAIQVLHALSKVPRTVLCDAGLEKTVEKLLGLVRQRAQGRWRFSPQDLADLLEAIQELDHVDHILVDAVCKRLPEALRLLSDDYRLFLRLWGSLAELSSKDRSVVRGWLHRALRLQVTIEERLVDAILELEGDASRMTLLAYACARLGYQGPAICEVLDALCQANQCGALSRTWSTLLIWSLTEMRIETDFVRAHVPQLLHNDRVSNNSGVLAPENATIGSLLRLAWTCVALRLELPNTVLEEICRSATEAWPLSADHLHIAKVVALEISLGLCQHSSLPQDVLRWWSSLLQSNEDETSGSLSSSREAAKSALGDVWLSNSLIRLKVPHESPFYVQNVYRMPVAMPQHQFLIDILCPGDLLIPSEQLTGAAALRQRQLAALGWDCHALAIHKIERAEHKGELDALLGPILASRNLLAELNAPTAGSL